MRGNNKCINGHVINRFEYNSKQPKQRCQRESQLYVNFTKIITEHTEIILKYVHSKLFITSLVITEYSIPDINLLGMERYPLKFPLYNRIFYLRTPKVSSGNKYTFHQMQKFFAYLLNFTMFTVVIQVVFIS